MIYSTGLVFIEASTGNGDRINEWMHHYIKGTYEVIEVDEIKQRIWCREEKIKFPISFDRIKRFEPCKKVNK